MHTRNYSTGSLASKIGTKIEKLVIGGTLKGVIRTALCPHNRRETALMRQQKAHIIKCYKSHYLYNPAGVQYSE
jgi:hypothetical protein